MIVKIYLTAWNWDLGRKINWELGLGTPHQDPPLKTKSWSKLVKWVLRMGRAESQILVTHSHLTNFGWSGELHHNLHLVTLPIVIKKLVN